MRFENQNPQNLNLLGHFIARIIANSCESGKKSLIRFPVKLKIIGGGMSILVSLRADVIQVKALEPDEQWDVQVQSSLKTFLDIALGGSIIKIFLTGKIKIKGNPIKILPLLPYLKLNS